LQPPGGYPRANLEAVQWRDGILSIEQAKTGRPLTLPLLPEATDALIAYLRDGRPASTSRHVFVRHRAPFEPFASGNDLAMIVRRALQRAGLDQRSGRRGLYLFRHTLASQMLSAGCPIKSIGDVLGHVSTDTTMEYASIDLGALRRVSLSEEEVRA
jgi:integrase/recombinase XerD